jgi:hypothetical protein
VDADILSASLATGEESSDSFTLSNTGSQPLTYNITVSDMRNLSRGLPLSLAGTRDGRNITGSTLTIDVSEYTPGAAQDWVFTASNASTDSEWLTDVIITFPTSVTVNSATNFVGGSGGELPPDNTSGNGITITWHGTDTSNWGLIHGGESAVATVNVTVAGVRPPSST